MAASSSSALPGLPSAVSFPANRWMTVADPIHGVIEFDRHDATHRLMLAIINSKAFQRLRRIKQMGLAEFVFPSATHNRFTHSLGAAHLMMMTLRQLKRVDRTAKFLATSYELNGQDTRLSFETLLLVGILVHDIGHGPFSHTLEDILNLKESGLHHDSHWNREILTHDPELVALWQATNPQLPEALMAFLGLTEGIEKHWLASLISSQLDMDRLDYLLRDSHFLGVKYGRIEDQRIVQNLYLVDHPALGHPVVAVRQEAVPAVEHYVFGRHQAYKMALHPLDKASEITLKKTMECFCHAVQAGAIVLPDDPLDPQVQLYALMSRTLSVHDYLTLDDGSVWYALQRWSHQQAVPLLAQLADRMLKHDLLKFVDIREYGVKGQLTDHPELVAQLQAHYAERGLDWTYGMDEVEVAPRPLYKQHEPIWVVSPQGVSDLKTVSSLPLEEPSSAKAPRGKKHLVFVWDTPTRQTLRALLTAYRKGGFGKKKSG